MAGERVAEEPFVERARRLIEDQYAQCPTGCGGSFGEVLCHELHTRGLTFSQLAAKWGISLHCLGELIYDHCKRLDNDPLVNHGYAPD
jgi:hypothetical protein